MQEEQEGRKACRSRRGARHAGAGGARGMQEQEQQEAAGHTAPAVRKQGEMLAGVQLAFSFSFTQFQTPDCRMAAWILETPDCWTTLLIFRASLPNRNAVTDTPGGRDISG